MRRDGLWHPALLAHVAALGHGDTLVVADPGLPVGDAPTVDLVWRRGEPRLLPVLEGVLAELVVEAAVVAREAQDRELLAGLAAALGDVPTTQRVPHSELKEQTTRARVVVRTGETTPYANVVLRCGVPF